jgi:hypothetical protein
MNRGDRVELAAPSHDDLTFGLTAGDRGTVDFTDSQGTIHVRWDSGKRIGIIAAERDLIRAAPADCDPPA